MNAYSRCLFVLAFIFGTLELGAVLYFGDFTPAETIYSVNANGSNLTNLGVNVSGSPTVDSLGLDLANNHIYFTGNFGDSVYRVDTDGSNGTTIVTVGGTPLLEHVEVDTVNNKLYWTQRGTGTGLYRADLDGSNATQISSVILLREIRVDNVNNKIYYAGNNHSVYSANLDGSDETVLYTGSSTWGVAVDPIAGNLYWTERAGSNPGIYRADLDGSNAQRIVSDATSTTFDSRSIMVDRTEDKIFWTNSAFSGGTPSVASADFDGSNPQLILSAGLGNPQGIGQPVIIPEPSTYALILGGLVIIVGVLLRSQRNQKNVSA